MSNYVKKDYFGLKGIESFSDKALDLHLGLYEGYVKNTNDILKILDESAPGTLEYSELQRRFGWEWNGMRLHELYFENMAKNKSVLDDTLAIGRDIKRIYGSLENWKNNFAKLGMMRGIGWVILYYDKQSKELFNVWINEHDTGHFSGATPLLVMDVFEHAYLLDFGKDRAGYIEAFMKNISWKTVEERFLLSEK